jgi:thioredoxin 1
MKNLSDKDFTNFLKENDLCMVMFGATWCGPCKALKPKVIDLKLNNVAYADIQVCRENAMTAEIMAVPTLVVFRSGKEVVRANRLTEEILSEIRS